MRDIDELKRVLREHFRSGEGVIAVYLFGSLTRETTHGLSDVDIAVLVDPVRVASRKAGGKFRCKSALVGGLMEALPMDQFDLVILNDTPPLLAHEVVKEGQVLLSVDEGARVGFEEEVKRKYLATQPLRDVKRRYLYERTMRGAFNRVHTP